MNIKLIAVCLGTLFLVSCSSSPRPENIYGKLIVDKAEYKFPIAVVSNNQPKTWSVLSSDGTTKFILGDQLRKKGFDVPLESFDVMSTRAKAKGTVAAIECSEVVSSEHIQVKSGGWPGYYSCTLYDLFDGSKIYEGEVGVPRGLFTNYDDAMRAGITYSLANLPKVRSADGKIIKSADVLEYLE